MKKFIIKVKNEIVEHKFSIILTAGVSLLVLGLSRENAAMASFINEKGLTDEFLNGVVEED